MFGFLKTSAAYLKQAGDGIRQIKLLNLSSLRKVFSLLGKKEKRIFYTLLAVALVSLLWSVRNFYYSVTKPAPAFGGIYTEGLLGQPTYLNPILAHENTDLGLVRLIYSSLYKYDNQGNLVPDLAQSMPEISENQKEYVVRLKNNAKWHNDRSLTADDVVFTIKTLQDPNYKSPLRNSWLSTNIEKLDEFTVKFTTQDISGPFIHNLALPILPEFIWSRVEPQNFLTSKYNLEAVGSGPYALKEIKKLASGKISSITMESFSNYFKGKPNADTLVFKFFDNEQELLNSFHSREIDGFAFTPLGSDLRLEKEQDRAEILKIPLPQHQVVFFNLKNKKLANINVRKALVAATDKQQIIEDVFYGNALIPASPLLFANQNNAAMESSGSDLKQAEKYLDLAGYAIDYEKGFRAKNGEVLELTIATNDFLPNSKAAEILASQWKKLNIKINLLVLPTKQLNDEAIRPRNFEVLLFPQKFGADPDPFFFWHSSQINNPGYNWTGFENETADKLITEGRTTTNRQIREQKYLEFNSLITQEAPAIFLNQTILLYAIDNKIKNVGINTLFEPDQRMFDLPNWYIMEKRILK